MNATNKSSDEFDLENFLQLDGTSEVITAPTKDHDTRSITEKILITVKAAPKPSAKYGDTVCVAGIRDREGVKQFVRLYPVPFRHLEGSEQFKKYDIVTYRVHPRSDDPRPESYSPERDSLSRISHLEKWNQRHEWIKPLADAFTLCEIRKRILDGKQSPTLALISTAEPPVLTVTLGKPWTPEQQASIDNHITQGDLFETYQQYKQLEAPRYEGRFNFRCLDKACSGHKCRFDDWEFVALQRRLTANQHDAVEQITQKYSTLVKEELAPAFYVGNTLRQPSGFGVLGIYPLNREEKRKR